MTVLTASGLSVLLEKVCVAIEEAVPGEDSALWATLQEAMAELDDITPAFRTRLDRALCRVVTPTPSRAERGEGRG